MLNKQQLYTAGGLRTRGNADGFSAFDLLDTPDVRLATPTIRLSNSILAWVRGCVQFVKLLQETSPEVFEGLPPCPDARHLFLPRCD